MGDTLHPAIRALAREAAHSLVRLVAYCGAVAGMGYGGLMAYERVQAAWPPPEPAPKAAWTETVPATPAFALELTDFLGSEPRHLVRRHVEGGGRRDLMIWGQPGSGAPAFSIEIYRPGAEEAEAALEVAAVTGLSASAYPAIDRGSIASKFGPFRLTHGPKAGEQGSACIGFARTFEELRVQISGVYCDQVARLNDRRLVACALDRLALLSAGGDAKLAGLFAHAQLRQSTCGPNRFPTAAPRGGEWLDTSAKPALRGRGG